MSSYLDKVSCPTEGQSQDTLHTHVLILYTHVIHTYHSLSSSQDDEDTQVSTIIVRGSTSGLMDDIERALDDGINTFKVTLPYNEVILMMNLCLKVLTRDGRMLPGGGSTEIELAKQLTTYGEVSE